MRDPKSEVAAAILMLLKTKCPIEKMLAVLTEFSTYTPETLGEHLSQDGMPPKTSGVDQLAFTSGANVYTERLLAEWYRWLMALTAWHTKDLSEAQVRQLFRRLNHPDSRTRRITDARRLRE